MLSGRIIGTIRAAPGNFICLIIRQLEKIINFFVHIACVVLVKGSIFASSNQNNTMTRIQNTHNTIKAKMANKTTAELIVVAQLARVQKSDEAMRMVYALTMDVIMSRVSEEEYELIESLMN